jgi:hypothetical protein
MTDDDDVRAELLRRRLDHELAGVRATPDARRALRARMRAQRRRSWWSIPLTAVAVVTVAMVPVVVLDAMRGNGEPTPMAPGATGANTGSPAGIPSASPTGPPRVAPTGRSKGSPTGGAQLLTPSPVPSHATVRSNCPRSVGPPTPAACPNQSPGTATP